MSEESSQLAVWIVRFVDQHFPGWVECEFIDAEGRRHTVRDKVPVFTSETLDSASLYPQEGTISCTALARWRDGRGSELVRITIARPFAIESTDGQTEFIVLAEQVSPGDVSADSTA
jgi:hypothetical protein